jgi:hypothetical protein
VALIRYFESSIKVRIAGGHVMDTFQVISIVTCLTSTTTMIIVCFAVLPHIKNGMAIVRDACLWAALVLFIFGLGWMGLQRISPVELRLPTAKGDQAHDPSAFADDFYAGR